MIEGYCVPLSVAAGGNIAFHVSAASGYTTDYVRLGVHGDEIAALGEPVQRPAIPQSTPAEPWRNGCGWDVAFSLDVPADWASGYYAARCTDSDGAQSFIVFVVKPAGIVPGRIAALASTNTWNAYNDWPGEPNGRSKYTPVPPGPVAYLSFARPSNQTAPIDQASANHTTRAELWIWGWLMDAGYEVDLYTDTDFHNGIEAFPLYKVLLLNTHSEYWTQSMVGNLGAFLEGGGSLINLSGNTMFERVDLDLANNRMIALDGDDGRDRSYCLFRNRPPSQSERDILGVGSRADNGYTDAPYAVLRADHRFFNNTMLVDYDKIGATGLNIYPDSGTNTGGASGWELSTSDAGTAPDGTLILDWRIGYYGPARDRGSAPANTILLARGANIGPQGAFGADMVTYRHGGGGQVFSVGSITFGGALVIDPVLQRIVGNVLDECLGKIVRPDGEDVGFMHLVYGGNGTVPVDSGLPRVGEIYGVRPDGSLHWYDYGGGGDADPGGTSSRWSAKSGHEITVGWQGFRHVFAKGDGVLFAVEPNGALRWYRYDGEAPDGGQRWAVTSGSTIGRGWNAFRFLCCKPWEGWGSTDSSAIYAVDTAGQLRWYRYLGEGQNDPSGGAKFWHENSGNVIGNGWSDGYRRMVAISDIILLVENDGTLRWHRYLGQGESNPGGAGPGWHPNSGNAIAAGWHAFRHIFGGSDGHGGYVIYGVEDNGDLRWRRYTGEGESDPEGASAAWTVNSGNIIGNGW